MTKGICSASMVGLGLAMLLLFATACSSDPLGDCPPNSLTQQSAGGMILATTCIGCHHSSLSGEDRRGAPEGSDFDKPDVVRDSAAAIYSTAETGEMPPQNQNLEKLPDIQVENLRIYLACLPE